ncbi:hypothetical protein ZIOFF_042143 [Zingiber officinale]|uniref:Uncharacterized protein n=2 Tax=Zingiber officinale TaxID=94328 RepID=A0A8J5KZE6_ZINOF|nr:hypothetical protein ZIOFF_042143 [Zingiber officinale]
MEHSSVSKGGVDKYNRGGTLQRSRSLSRFTTSRHHVEGSSIRYAGAAISEISVDDLVEEFFRARVESDEESEPSYTKNRCRSSVASYLRETESSRQSGRFVSRPHDRLAAPPKGMSKSIFRRRCRGLRRLSARWSDSSDLIDGLLVEANVIGDHHKHQSVEVHWPIPLPNFASPLLPNYFSTYCDPSIRCFTSIAMNPSIDFRQLLNRICDAASFYLAKPRSSVKDLCKAADQLSAKLKDVDQAMGEPKGNGKTATEEALQWKCEAEAFVSTEVAVIQEDYRAMRCLIGWSWNCISINQRVTKKLEEVKELINRVDVSSVATTRSPPPAVELPISNNVVGMQSDLIQIVKWKDYGN